MSESTASSRRRLDTVDFDAVDLFSHIFPATIKNLCVLSSMNPLSSMSLWASSSLSKHFSTLKPLNSHSMMRANPTSLMPSAYSLHFFPTTIKNLCVLSSMNPLSSMSLWTSSSLSKHFSTLKPGNSHSIIRANQTKAPTS